MAGDYGLTSILGTFANSNNPNLTTPKGANLGAAMFGLGMPKPDKNKQELATHAPSTLSDEDLDKQLPNIISGAIAKQGMSAHKPSFDMEKKDLSVDTSGLGDFGEVNTNAGTNVTGAAGKSNKTPFWESKGGGIVSSLLGVLAMGGLGYGIGAVSGGRRGGAQGAAYGLGLGTLQDLSLRKQGMEAAYNQQQAQQKLAELQNSQRGSLEKDMEYLKANPQDMPLFEKFQAAKNPFAAANLGIRQEVLQNQQDKEKRIEAQNIDSKVQALGKEAKPIKSVLNTYDVLEKQLGFNLDSYNRKTNKAIDKDGKEIDVDIPGMTNPLTGKRITAYDMTGAAQSLDSTMQAIMNLDIKQFAGSAVSAQETERIQRAYAAGAFREDADKIDALQKFRQLMREGLKDTEAGYSPEVQQKYRQNRPQGAGAVKGTAPTQAGDPSQDALQRLLDKGYTLEQLEDM